jgi:hypothetical protein
MQQIIKITFKAKQRTPKMDIKRSRLQPSGKGQAEYFTGTVRIYPLFQAKDPARVVGAFSVPLLRLKAFYAAARCRLNGLIIK